MNNEDQGSPQYVLTTTGAITKLITAKSNKTNILITSFNTDLFNLFICLSENIVRNCPMLTVSTHSNPITYINN
ncbi:hypothetical protein C7M41_01505 [Pediococcus acidilactici]|nr:hypothetical protein C7M41_01505 [Pediococcus acidilactici]QHM54852.1 hypothetical protein C7M42_01593 [Pediococcus acidilactici]